MVSISRLSFIPVIASTAATALFAGGYWLELGKASASSDPRAKDAAVIVRSLGCGQPSKSTVAATAEGLVQGRRQSVPLKAIALAEPGVYAISRDFPQDGAWVLSVVGTYEGHTASVLAQVTTGGFERKSVKSFQGRPPEREIEAALRIMSARASN